MKLVTSLIRIKWYLIITALAAGGLFYYFNMYAAGEAEETLSFYVVDEVEYGAVSSGIQTTGEIVAAQKLDIDVYKQQKRIDVVNIQNGSHVEEGDVLISFDKSDAYVDVQSAAVSVAEAKLDLEAEEADMIDPSTEIRSKESQIAGYEKTIADAEQDIIDAYRDFLNEDLEVYPHDDRYESLKTRTEPTLSGRYTNDQEGYYIIDVYASGAASGYSYRVTGLESYVEAVIVGKAIDLGNSGLKITFPSDTKNNDKWIVYVPNTKIVTYAESKADYENQVANLEKTIRDTKVSLLNAEQELEDLIRDDGVEYRNLNVEKAETSLAEAQQRLVQNYDSVEELDIVAPFSGTIEGMENVVEGATPEGGTSDPTNLGTLISDEFLTTFTLGASDVSQVSVGQKVKVTITSFSEQPIYIAAITQISSLPESSGVAQYEVQALLEYNRASSSMILREGMLADIEIVQEENENALRVPTAAITYEQGQPKVTIIDSLTEQQQQQVARMGIVRTDNGTLETYTVDVELGIAGQYYVEILSGVEEGDIIITSSLTTETSESVVEQAGFGPGSGRNAGADGPPPG